MSKATLSDRFVKTFRAPAARTDYGGRRRDRACASKPLCPGRKSWCVVYRVRRRKRRMTLGTYPAVTLAAARKKAREARDQIQLRNREKRPWLGLTVETWARRLADLCAESLERHDKRHERSWKEDERIVNAEVLRRW